MCKPIFVCLHVLKRRPQHVKADSSMIALRCLCPLLLLLFFQRSIYLLDWLFWLTKAGESKCTTCYAAEVCQASNTCSLSDAYFIMAPLSQESRHLCVCVFFLFLSRSVLFVNPVLDVYLDLILFLSPSHPQTSLSLFAAELVSPSISIFLPLVRPFLSSFSHSLSPSVRVLLWQASKQTAYNTEAHQAASAVRSTHPSHPSCCTTEAPLFHLWTETKSGNPSRSTLSRVWFIIYFQFLNNTCSCIPKSRISQSCAGRKHAETLR